MYFNTLTVCDYFLKLQIVHPICSEHMILARKQTVTVTVWKCLTALLDIVQLTPDW